MTRVNPTAPQKWGQAEASVEACAARRVPRGPQRREQLVCVAEQVFLESGFAETTMQTIASRAGASKETLYRHFASKEALFAEVVGRRAAQVSGSESALSLGGPPRRVLFELGCGVLTLMTQGEAVPLLRLVIAESTRTPELGAILYAKGPAATLNLLTDYLRGATQRGELRCRRPEQAARLFIGAVIANYRVRALIDPPKTPIGEKEIRAHVRAAVAMFLAYYARK
ncbi:MAG: TetR/AcrR family transcriptional regulator [Methylocystis sp.]